MLRFLRKLIANYLVTVGLLGHLVLLVLGLRWFYAGQLAGPPPVQPIETVPMVAGQADLAGLPRGTWCKLAERAEQADFRFQVHGGSAWDPARQRIWLFGSDTHGSDWDNGLTYFDTRALRWGRATEPSDWRRYDVTPQGIPAVAGVAHPWAMHTFDALVFDTLRDRLVVASFPGHMSPDRFGQALTHVWPKVRRHPTWVYRFADATWQALPGEAQHFFPYATAFDTRRGQLIGVKADGIYAMQSDSGQWKRLTGKDVPYVYHNNAVYDPRRDLVWLFGGHNGDNTLAAYDVAANQVRARATPGLRPPSSNAQPVAWHADADRLVALIDGRDAAGLPATDTWLYDPVADRWQKLAGASLPFALGMNYKLQYDQVSKTLWLLAREQAGVMSAWALRI